LKIHDLRPGSAEVGGGMKVGLGQDETFVDVVVGCCKGFLVGKKTWGKMHFEFHIKLEFRECSGREKYPIC